MPVRYFRAIRSLVGSRTAVLWLVLAGVLGCGGQDQVRHYEIPAQRGADPAASQGVTPSELAAGSTVPPAMRAAANAQRMLAAIVRPASGDQQQAWFFKAQGSRSDIQSIRAGFLDLVRSIRFDAQGRTPQWGLPSGWQQQPGNQIRYATIVSGSQEVSVTALPVASADWNQYVLLNINRWRGQLGLPPVVAEQLDEQTDIVETADGSQAILVDLAREDVVADTRPSATHSGAADREGDVPADAHSTQAGSDAEKTTGAETGPAGSDVNGETASPQRQSAGGMSFVVPENWKPGRTSAFRQAAFLVEADGQQAEITVIALGPNAGSVLDNVNRWRSQIGQGPITKDDLGKHVKSVRIDKVDAQYVELPGADAKSKAILAVIVPLPDRTIFVKLTGDTPLALKEKKHFEQFVQSIRF